MYFSTSWLSGILASFICVNCACPQKQNNKTFPTSMPKSLSSFIRELFALFLSRELSQLGIAKACSTFMDKDYERRLHAYMIVRRLQCHRTIQGGFWFMSIIFCCHISRHHCYSNPLHIDHRSFQHRWEPASFSGIDHWVEGTLWFWTSAQ